MRVRFIKRAFKDIEAAIPYEAVLRSWERQRSPWLSKVTTATSLVALRNCLCTLEAHMKKEWVSEYHLGMAREPSHPPPLDVLAENTEEYAWSNQKEATLDWL